MFNRKLAAVLAISLGTAASVSHGADYKVNIDYDQVDSSGDPNLCLSDSIYCSLRDAILAANKNPGPDTITLPSGTYSIALGSYGEDAGLEDDFDITDDLTITGETENDQNTTIIDGQGNAALFDVHTDVGIEVTLNNLVLKNAEGNGTRSGAAFRADRQAVSLNLNNVLIDGSFSPGQGGAIFLRGANNSTGAANLSIVSSRFINNRSGKQAGVIQIDYAKLVHITKSVFNDNAAGLVDEKPTQNNGVMSSSAAELVIEDSEFNGNEASNYGVLSSSGKTTIVGSTFKGNTASSSTAVLYLTNHSHIKDSTFQNNVSGTNYYYDYGVIYNHNNAYLVLENNVFEENKTTRYPTITSNGLLHSFNNRYANNTSQYNGGAIYSASQLFSRQDQFINNTSNNGGAIYVQNGNFAVSQSSFEGNGAENSGGAIYINTINVNNSDWHIYNSSFAYNDANTVPANNGAGGAIFTKARLEIIGSTFYQNSAYTGGGLYLDQNVRVDIKNSTFHENAVTSSSGASIQNNGGGNIVLVSTILSAPSGAEHCGGGDFPISSYNLIASNPTDTSCAVSEGQNPIKVATALLGSYDDHGGPTNTINLQEGSNAINNGNPGSCWSVDQRGLLRVGTCDIGSFEFNASESSESQITFSADADIKEKQSGYNDITLTASRSGNLDFPVSLFYFHEVNDSTSPGSDLREVNYTATWQRATSNDLSLPMRVLNDQTTEGDETALFKPIVQYGFASAVDTTFSILDSPGVFNYTTNGIVTSSYYHYITVPENIGSLKIDVNRISGIGGGISFLAQSSPQTATEDDYTVYDETFNFSNGESGPKSIVVPITNDTEMECGSEYFNIYLTNFEVERGDPISDTTFRITIEDDEDATTKPQVFFKAENEADNYRYEVLEGNAVRIYLQRDTNVCSAATVQVTADSEGLNSDSNDYTTTTSNVYFGASARESYFNFYTKEDSEIEGNQRVRLKITDGGGANVINDGYILVTIIDDDSPPTVSFDKTGIEVNEDAGVARLTVVRSGLDTDDALTMNFEVTDGSAKFGSDFSTQSGTVSFYANQTTSYIDITLKSDNGAVSGDRFFTVKLLDKNGVEISPSGGAAQVLLKENDTNPGESFFSIATDQESFEEGENAVLIITRSGDLSQGASVGYTVNSNTAEGNRDFYAITGSVTFAANESQKRVYIPIIDDVIADSDETFSVSLNTPVGGDIQVDGDVANVTIIDEDPVDPPSEYVYFQLEKTAVLEGVSGDEQTLTLIREGGDISQSMSVDFTASSDSGIENSLFENPTGTVTFEPNSRKARINFKVDNDSTTTELERAMKVALSNTSNGAALVRNESEVTIIDDEALKTTDKFPGIIIVGNHISVQREDVGSDIKLEVQRIGGSFGTVSVDVQSGGLLGTADLGLDYTVEPAVVEFADGDSTPKYITLKIINDTEDELDYESIVVALSNATNGAFVGINGGAVLDIQDEDCPAGKQFDDTTNSCIDIPKGGSKKSGGGGGGPLSPFIWIGFAMMLLFRKKLSPTQTV